MNVDIWEISKNIAKKIKINIEEGTSGFFGEDINKIHKIKIKTDKTSPMLVNGSIFYCSIDLENENKFTTVDISEITFFNFNDFVKTNGGFQIRINNISFYENIGKINFSILDAGTEIELTTGQVTKIPNTNMVIVGGKSGKNIDQYNRYPFPATLRIKERNKNF